MKDGKDDGLLLGFCDIDGDDDGDLLGLTVGYTEGYDDGSLL